MQEKSKIQRKESSLVSTENLIYAHHVLLLYNSHWSLVSYITANETVPSVTERIRTR